MSSIVDQLPAGAFTISGDTRGPAVNLGRNRYNKSQLIFLDEGTLRVANKAFAELGFVNPETHKEVADALAGATAELDQAKAYVAELEDRVAGAEKGLKFDAAAKARIAELEAAVKQAAEDAAAEVEKVKAELEQAKAKPAPAAKPKAARKQPRAKAAKS